MKLIKAFLFVITMMLALGGCVSDDAGSGIPGGIQSEPSAQTPQPTPLMTPKAAPERSPEPMPTAAAAPVETTRPDVEPASEPTPEPTPKPTPEPAKADDGRVELAKGFYYMKLNDEIKDRITGISYPEDDDDIAISYSDLRYVRIKYRDFEGDAHNGELIINKKLADDVLEIFYELYKAEYPLASVRLVDGYGQPGDDTLSMEDNNTSAFCYRRVTGSKTLSRHSLGAAIDINPMMNPYIDGERVAPENGANYVDRSLGLPGMIDHDDLCYKLFKKHGWSWGGDWKGDKDYQHFSKDIG